jgi:hypothetical protein
MYHWRITKRFDGKTEKEEWQSGDWNSQTEDYLKSIEGNAPKRFRLFGKDGSLLAEGVAKGFLAGWEPAEESDTYQANRVEWFNETDKTWGENYEKQTQ